MTTKTAPKTSLATATPRRTRTKATATPAPDGTLKGSLAPAPSAPRSQTAAELNAATERSLNGRLAAIANGDAGTPAPKVPATKAARPLPGKAPGTVPAPRRPAARKPVETKAPAKGTGTAKGTKATVQPDGTVSKGTGRRAATPAERAAKPLTANVLAYVEWLDETVYAGKMTEAAKKAAGVSITLYGAYQAQKNGR